MIFFISVSKSKVNMDNMWAYLWGFIGFSVCCELETSCLSFLSFELGSTTVFCTISILQCNNSPTSFHTKCHLCTTGFLKKEQKGNKAIWLLDCIFAGFLDWVWQGPPYSCTVPKYRRIKGKPSPGCSSFKSKLPSELGFFVCFLISYLRLSSFKT